MQIDFERPWPRFTHILAAVGFWIGAIAAIIVMCAALWFAAAGAARAHMAPTGWVFDPMCCGNSDCYPIPANAISETPQGYRIEETGEVLPYSSPKVKPSPDGMFYRCSSQGKPKGTTYCIYVNKGGV